MPASNLTPKPNSKLSYWQSQTVPLFPDLAWNLPETPRGHLLLLGGHSQSSATIIRLSETLHRRDYRFGTITTVLPDSLERTLPDTIKPFLTFTPSATSGSFDRSTKLESLLNSADFNLLLGDFSKNATTYLALTAALKNTLTPTLLTRDAIEVFISDAEDLLNIYLATSTQSTSTQSASVQSVSTPTTNPNTITSPPFFLLASLTQLTKLLRALYYPKFLPLSAPLLAALETLHKFTLTYDRLVLITFHQNQIILAHRGDIITTPITNTKYSPLTLWSGTLAANLALYNLHNPAAPLAASAAALLH